MAARRGACEHAGQPFEVLCELLRFFVAPSAPAMWISGLELDEVMKRGGFGGVARRSRLRQRSRGTSAYL